MIVYAQRKQIVRPASLPLLTDPLDALIEWGEAESAAADALCPERDSLEPALTAFRTAMRQAARVYWSGTGSLPALDVSALPSRLEVSVPEGYAFYALDPRTYGEAAVRFWEDERPRLAVVIGIRSIGASLSAVVCAALEERGCAVQSYTVRPRGHPFDRRLEVDSPLVDEWRRAHGSHFLVVDEGPGLSGSSFASVARALRETAGVPDERIVFFPSWNPDGTAFVSEAARDEWRRHRRVAAAPASKPPGEDLSAGNWRTLFYPAGCGPPVHPQHERRKFLDDGVLWKFAGIGKYGRAKRERAQVLSEAGFTPPPVALESGYLGSRFVNGRPVTGANGGLLARLRAYLNFLDETFRIDAPVPVDAIDEMVANNAPEALPELRKCVAAVCNENICAIDGRMLPHEWIETLDGYLKTDALDHHNDHFFPGCQSVLWDLAAATIEFGLDESTGEYLYHHCRQSGRYYELAYLSYRAGYCSMAANSLCSPEADRFRVGTAFYRRRLQETLSHG